MRGLSQTPINDVATYALTLGGAEVNVEGDVVTVRSRTREDLRRIAAYLSWRAAQGRWPRGSFALRMVTP